MRTYRQTFSGKFDPEGQAIYKISCEGGDFNKEGIYPAVTDALIAVLGDEDGYEEASEAGEVYCKLQGQEFKTLIASIRDASYSKKSVANGPLFYLTKK